MLPFSSRRSTWYFIVVLSMCSYGITAQNCKNRNLLLKMGDTILSSSRNNVEIDKSSSSTPKISRNKCCPYDFDSNFCRLVDDRLLCGYNKNVGNPISNKVFEKLTGGCRLRGDRLECGYDQGPFNNPRRPPVWDNPQTSSEDESLDENVKNLGPETLKLFKKNSATTSNPSRVTKCIETSDNRIVCRDV